MLYIELNSFIVLADQLEGIPIGQAGLSKFQRDGMSISKHDELLVGIAKI